MTSQEIRVLNLTRDVWNEFLKLPTVHPTDQVEFMHHMHALQNILLAREGMRKLAENDKAQYKAPNLMPY